MDALQIELDSAKQECEATNPWTSATHAMLPAVLAEQRKQAAELALWRAGRCCTMCKQGRCGNRRVVWARESQLINEGMGRRNAAVLAEICEHSQAWKLIEMTRTVLADESVDLSVVVKTVLEANQGAGDV